MNWELAIKLNRDALVRLVAMLFEASGLVPGRTATLPPIIRRAVLDILRPAESAARRLIVILALELGVPEFRKRAALSQPIPRGAGQRAAVFALFDPVWRVGAHQGRKYARHTPRILSFDDPYTAVEPVAVEVAPSKDDPVDAARLLRRMEALKRALDNLPREARRLARAKVQRAQKPRRLRLQAPMRPGRPPGHRTRGRFEIDEILRECHTLALRAVAAHDTS